MSSILLCLVLVLNTFFNIVTAFIISEKKNKKKQNDFDWPSTSLVAKINTTL